MKVRARPWRTHSGTVADGERHRRERAGGIQRRRRKDQVQESPCANSLIEFDFLSLAQAVLPVAAVAGYAICITNYP